LIILTKKQIFLVIFN